MGGITKEEVSEMIEKAVREASEKMKNCSMKQQPPSKVNWMPLRLKTPN